MNDSLPLLVPDAGRNARTLARCHARLEAHRRKLEDQAQTPALQGVRTERLVLAGACFAYLAAVVGNVLRTIAAR